MPLYQYHCRDCRDIFEAHVPSHSRNVPTEAECGFCGGKIRRSFHLNVVENTTAAARTALRRARERAIHLEDNGGMEGRVPNEVIDPYDLARNPEAFGVDDSGERSTHDREVREGRREPRRVVY